MYRTVWTYIENIWKYIEAFKYINKYGSLQRNVKCEHTYKTIDIQRNILDTIKIENIAWFFVYGYVLRT